MNFITLFITGIVLGISNVIPGVSGGTMAVVFGIYDKLISIITFNVKKILKEWKFILPLVSGLAVGIIVFSKLITFLFSHYPIPTNWFFIGLIMGSSPLIYGKIKKSSKINTLSLPCIISFLFSLALMVVMIIAKKEFAVEEGSSTVLQIPALSLMILLKLFLAGFLAALAMIIPGISGSFLIVVIGMYTTVIASVSTFNIPFLGAIALGAIVGLLGGAKLVRILMKKIPSQTYSAILGLIIGSLIVIFPGFIKGIQLIFSILLFSGGFALSYFSCKKET